MIYKPTFSEAAERFKISAAKVAEMGITAEKAAAAFANFARAYWQAVFQESIYKKFPDPAKFQGSTLEIPVEALQPKNMLTIADYRCAIFTKEEGQWQFSHFEPSLEEITSAP